MIKATIERVSWENNYQLQLKYSDCIEAIGNRSVFLEFQAPHWLHRFVADAAPARVTVENRHVEFYRLALAAGVQIIGVAKHIPYSVPYQIGIEYVLHGEAEFVVDGVKWLAVARTEYDEANPAKPSRTVHIESGMTFRGHLEFTRL